MMAIDAGKNGCKRAREKGQKKWCFNPPKKSREEKEV